MNRSVDYSLYLATDDTLLAGRDVAAAVKAAVESGVSIVQLRLKNASSREFYEIGQRVHAVTSVLEVPLIINDRVDIMLALGAEGVHVGRGDLPLARVRALAGKRIVGYSVNTAEHLEEAMAAGVDYVGLGPVFATATKADTGPALGLAGVAELVAATELPCVAIGGIAAANMADVLTTGVAGCCVVSAILGQPDIGRATRELREIIRQR
jgi:thiamine-phosphate pyrophosphorylase